MQAESLVEYTLHDEDMRQWAGDYLAEHCAYFAGLLLSEYLNDISDPDFDVVGDFLAHTSIRLDMFFALTDQLSELVQAYCTSSLLEDIKVRPDFINDAVDDDYAALIANNLIRNAIRQPELQQLVEQLTTTILIDQQAELRAACAYGRPVSCIPGARSHMNIQPKYRQIWLETDPVPADQAIQVLDSPVSTLQLDSLPHANNNVYTVTIDGDTRLQEVITDSVIAMTSRSDSSGRVDLEIDAEGCSYVMVIGATEAGERQVAIFAASLEAFKAQYFTVATVLDIHPVEPAVVNSGTGNHTSAHQTERLF
jgi:hypothetical protein